jgi:hypothetical protein
MKKAAGRFNICPLPFALFSRFLRVSGDAGEPYDLRGRCELPVFHAPPVQAMPRDADRVMQVVELFAIEPDGFLRTPTEAVRPRREAQRDDARAFFKHYFDLLVFAG